MEGVAEAPHFLPSWVTHFRSAGMETRVPVDGQTTASKWWSTAWQWKQQTTVTHKDESQSIRFKVQREESTYATVFTFKGM